MHLINQSLIKIKKIRNNFNNNNKFKLILKIKPPHKIKNNKNYLKFR